MTGDEDSRSSSESLDAVEKKSGGANPSEAPTEFEPGEVEAPAEDGE